MTGSEAYRKLCINTIGKSFKQLSMKDEYKITTADNKNAIQLFGEVTEMPEGAFGYCFLDVEDGSVAMIIMKYQYFFDSDTTDETNKAAEKLFDSIKIR